MFDGVDFSVVVFDEYFLPSGLVSYIDHATCGEMKLLGMICLVKPLSFRQPLLLLNFAMKL